MLSPILVSILSAETIGDAGTFAVLPILFVVVICARIFIIWPFLVTEAIFSHTQQRNLKIRKICYKFQTAEVPCNCSALQ